MRLLFFILFLSQGLTCFAQRTQTIQLSFNPTYINTPVRFGDKYYSLPKGDSIMFETFKCYISALELYNNGKKVYTEPESFHLLNSENEDLSFSVKIPADIQYNSIHFNLGIDSATSNSGALSGDLDPAKGMFWTWQSGYINCKLEGRSNLCPTRHHEFRFHLGGYAAPDNALQKINLKVLQQGNITINIPLEKFISGIDLRNQHSIMIPGHDAVILAKKIAAILRVQ